MNIVCSSITSAALWYRFVVSAPIEHLGAGFKLIQCRGHGSWQTCCVRTEGGIWVKRRAIFSLPHCRPGKGGRSTLRQHWGINIWCVTIFVKILNQSKHATLMRSIFNPHGSWVFPRVKSRREDSQTLRRNVTRHRRCSGIAEEKERATQEEPRRHIVSLSNNKFHQWQYFLNCFYIWKGKTDKQIQHVASSTLHQTAIPINGCTLFTAAWVRLREEGEVLCCSDTEARDKSRSPHMLGYYLQPITSLLLFGDLLVFS